jgi:hypothetical protein
VVGVEQRLVQRTLHVVIGSEQYTSVPCGGRVDRSATESVVARIAGLVGVAARTKAKPQLVIEKIEPATAL